MPELKCPQIESNAYLCDRAGEYQVDGTIYCARHARRLMEQKTERESATSATGEVAITPSMSPIGHSDGPCTSMVCTQCP
jgi:hypothetical protein